jgi:signal transduction histidine kinase
MHALRTPLTAVILRVNLLRRRLRGSDDHRQLDDDLARIEGGLDQLVVAIAAMDQEKRDMGGADTIRPR